ncbi:DUF3108 domain-containing protein [Albidovulum sp.]
MTIARRNLPAALAAAALAALVAALPAAAAERTDSAVFDLSLRGIHAGTLSIAGQIQGESYAAAGVLKSGGLLALIRKIRYDARSRGRVKDGRFTPQRYEEDADTGKRVSRAVMDYVDGVPQVKKYDPPKPPREDDIDPATQGGTVDPLTALYAVTRDKPRAEACNLKLTLFDGRRRSEVTLAAPEARGEALVCAGEYRRLAGFSEKDMAEKTRFPFVMRLEPLADGTMRVVEISMDTLYGKGRLKRR